MIDNNSLNPYLEILPEIIIAFVASLLLTPLVGVLAQKFGFVDLPATMRKRSDPSIAQRLHTKIKPRLGTLAVIIPLFFLFMTSFEANQQTTGILIGMLILTVVGALDDKYELSSKVQFPAHFLAAAIVVLSGITIETIRIAGVDFDFNMFERALHLGNFTYNFIFPADLITIFWIMSIINALNWVCGIDALGEGMTFIAAVTLMLLSIKFGPQEYALISGVLAGGMLGFIPYNFPPSKIFGGTINTAIGFLVAVLAILNGGKISTSLILLSIPIIDMIWVIIYRVGKHRHVGILKRPFVGGRVHLHHRIMELGFTQKQTLYIEMSLMALVSIFAYYLAGFSITLITILGVAAVILIIFTLISIVSYRVRTRRALAKLEDDDTPDDGQTPEEKYAY